MFKVKQMLYGLVTQTLWNTIFLKHTGRKQEFNFQNIQSYGAKICNKGSGRDNLQIPSQIIDAPHSQKFNICFIISSGTKLDNKKQTLCCL